MFYQTAIVLFPLTFCAPTPQFAVASSTPGGFAQSCVNGVCQTSSNGLPLDVGGSNVVPSVPAVPSTLGSPVLPATSNPGSVPEIGGVDPAAAGLVTPSTTAGGGLSPAAFVSNFFSSLPAGFFGGGGQPTTPLPN